jgi:Sulfatase
MTAPKWPVAFLHLAALWAFAFVQPLLDLLRHNSDFFVARGNTSSDILWFSLGLVLVPPALLLAVELAGGAVSGHVRVALHTAFVAVLAAAFALEAIKAAIHGDAAPIAVATVLGVAFAAAYARAAPVRSFMTVLSPAPVVFLALFLVSPSISELLRPEAAVASTTGPPAKTPVVLVIFDELPAISLMGPGERIDAARFPAFGRLARDTTWYRNATTVSDSTTLAVPAILSGLRPSKERRLPTSRSYPHNVFTLLGARYRQHVVEPVTDLCPASMCGGGPRSSASHRIRSLVSDLSVVAGHLTLPDGLARRLPPIDRGWADFTGDEQGGVSALGRQRTPDGVTNDWWAQQVDAAERGIEVRPAAAGKPAAYIVHFILPHVPWRYLPSGRRYPEPGPTDVPGPISGVGWGPNADLVREGWARHLLQVGFADRLVGQLRASLERAGLWDRALVVVTADHGASFRPAGARRPVDSENFADIANVPLFVKQPFQRRGGADDRLARTIDVLPTIAKRVGGGRGWRYDGAPLDAGRAEITLTVNNNNERRDHSLGAAAFFHARDARVARQAQVFPPGPASVLRVGPAPRLLDRAVTSLPRVRAKARLGTVDRSASYRRVDPRSGVVPALATGRLASREPGGLVLAIAVDGRIRATARSYRQAGTTRFAAMLPERALSAGAHHVEVFAVGRGDALRPVAGSAEG